ncbi:MAG: hypothetical protein AAGA29_08360 [Planctomycetota bacterium]
MNDIVPATSDEQIKHYLRHFVCLVWSVQKNNDETIELINRVDTTHSSGFVISVNGHWVWITAGHVIDEIVKYKEDADYKVINPRLFDRWFDFDRNSDDKGIPISIEMGRMFSVSNEESGTDYGGLLLNNLEVEAMKRSGIEPLDERYWASFPPMADFKICQLLGLPADTTEKHKAHRTKHIVRISEAVRPVLAPASPLKSADAQFLTDHPRVICKLRDDLVPDDPADGEAIKNIKGMSGGPLFGLWQFSDGTTRYRVVGIQSGVFPENRLITACPVAVIASTIKSYFEHAEKQRASVRSVTS